jgi:hypothetical protein
LSHSGSSHRFPPPWPKHLLVLPTADLSHSGSSHRFPPPWPKHLLVLPTADLSHGSTEQRLRLRLVFVTCFKVVFIQLLALAATSSESVVMVVALAVEYELCLKTSEFESERSQNKLNHVYPRPGNFWQLQR